MDNIKVTAIITAAGRGCRAKLNKNKVLSVLPNGNSILLQTALAFDRNSKINHIIFTSSKDDLKEISNIAENLATPSKVVEGGDTRTKSVYNALLNTDDEIVLIHDGARPFVSQEIIDECIDSIIKYGSAVATIPCTDTIANLDDDNAIISASRKNKRLIQTPQGFFTEKIKEAYQKITPEDEFTDDAGVYCKYQGKVYAINGSEKNIKLTYPKDFQFLPPDIKVGVGFDLHTLVEGRKLILGGIEVAHVKGLLGHSDADVLTHAICDAILSALALRDIGYHFSDKDPKYKDISSMILLEKVKEMMEEKGYKVNNLSAVIMAEKPKLMGYIPKITENIANALDMDFENVGITCTTTEKIGIVGREEGIAVNCYCTLIKR